MPAESAPLRLGCRVSFEDRWQGRLTSIDITENWEVTNITVTSGLLFTRSSVKLPFSAVSHWSDASIFIEANSFKAFAREIPPMAAPARPLSGNTPIALPGARLSGLIVGTADRRAKELLLALGPARRLHRLPIAQAHFEGKAIALEVQAHSLPQYESDANIAAHIRDAITEDRTLTSDDKQALTVAVTAGFVKISGNVRVRTTLQRLYDIASAQRGVLGVRVDAAIDSDLEFAIAAALQDAGISRRGSIYPRSNLGTVVLYGRVTAPGVADDAVRVTTQVSGVRSVASRLSLAPERAAA